jgi:hypothetical protein
MLDLLALRLQVLLITINTVLSLIYKFTVHRCTRTRITSGLLATDLNTEITMKPSCHFLFNHPGTSELNYKTPLDSSSLLHDSATYYSLLQLTACLLLLPLTTHSSSLLLTCCFCHLLLTPPAYCLLVASAAYYSLQLTASASEFCSFM